MYTRSCARVFAALAVPTRFPCGNDRPGPGGSSPVQTLLIESPGLPRGSLYLNDSTLLAVRGVTERGDTIPVYGVSWSSRAPDVAAFGSTGYLRAVSHGRVDVTATSGSLSTTRSIQVAGTLHNRPVTSSEVWSLAGSPHVVDSVLIVGGDPVATLTVEPGVSVFFRDGAELNVGAVGEGRVIADGDAAALRLEHEDSLAEASASWSNPARGSSAGRRVSR